MHEVLRRAWQVVGAWLARWPTWGSAARALLDRRVETDPELEHLAERAFGELRQTPLVRPSRDIAEAVKQRLQQAEGGQPAASDTDPPGAPQE